MRREWIVTVVCGASGVGKSSVAIPLAARYGVPLGETDDPLALGVRRLLVLIIFRCPVVIRRDDRGPSLR